MVNCTVEVIKVLLLIYFWSGAWGVKGAPIIVFSFSLFDFSLFFRWQAILDVNYMWSMLRKLQRWIPYRPLLKELTVSVSRAHSNTEQIEVSKKQRYLPREYRGKGVNSPVESAIGTGIFVFNFLLKNFYIIYKNREERVMSPYELITQLHYQRKVVSSTSSPPPHFHPRIILKQIPETIGFLL